MDSKLRSSEAQPISSNDAVAAAPERADGTESEIDLSVVVPFYDEEELVERVYDAITAVCSQLGLSYEIVMVDDGSTDGTYGLLNGVAGRDPRVKVVHFGRNFGQTAAMAAGFDFSEGRVIIPMDGDLQNDPADIPLLLAKLDEGYDIVSGWRAHRRDSFRRRIMSRTANWLIGRVTGVRLHDYGCTMKAYRARVLRETRLYGEMHRFIPALAHLEGARITEMPVRHHPRRFGHSKIRVGRVVRVLLDLLTVKFLSSYGTKPSYIFGGSGLLLCLGGIAAGAKALYDKYVNGVYVYRNPVILLAVFLFLLGFVCILMGLLAELIVRTYHESQAKPIYRVRETVNVSRSTAGSRL
jgi:glycosyltransferase involved in cell wall biosynthesis